MIRTSTSNHTLSGISLNDNAVVRAVAKVSMRIVEK